MKKKKQKFATGGTVMDMLELLFTQNNIDPNLQNMSGQYENQMNRNPGITPVEETNTQIDINRAKTDLKSASHWNNIIAPLAGAVGSFAGDMLGQAGSNAGWDMFKKSKSENHAVGGVAGSQNIRVDNGELMEFPNGQMAEVKGDNPNAVDGVGLNAPIGTKISSDRVRIDGVTMADRKKKRTKNEDKLSKARENNKMDSLIKNALELTQGNNQAEEEFDTNFQQNLNNEMQRMEQEEQGYAPNMLPPEALQDFENAGYGEEDMDSEAVQMMMEALGGDPGFFLGGMAGGEMPMGNEVPMGGEMPMEESMIPEGEPEEYTIDMLPPELVQELMEEHGWTEEDFDSEAIQMLLEALENEGQMGEETMGNEMMNPDMMNPDMMGGGDMDGEIPGFALGGITNPYQKNNWRSKFSQRPEDKSFLDNYELPHSRQLLVPALFDREKSANLDNSFQQDKFASWRDKFGLNLGPGVKNKPLESSSSAKDTPIGKTVNGVETEDTDNPKSKNTWLNNYLKHSMPTLGDSTVMLANLLGPRAAMMNTLKNRAGDTPTPRGMAQVRDKTLAEYDKIPQYLQAALALGTKQLQDESRTSARSMRNQARGVNQALAGDIARQSGVNKALSANTAKFMEMMGGHQQGRAQMMQNLESAIAQENLQAKLQDDANRDNFHTQYGRDISSIFQGVGQVGKDLNALKLRGTTANTLANMYDIVQYNPNGSISLKPGWYATANGKQAMADWEKDKGYEKANKTKKEYDEMSLAAKKQLFEKSVRG